jgi:hypothetical protein
MNLSKSKYCNGVQCKKMLWLDTYYPSVKGNVSNESVLDNGTEVGELAKGLLGSHIDISFNENLNVMIDDTFKALENDEVVITEASFDYHHCFCSVDLLKKSGNDYAIYEVKSSTEIKDVYLDDISYQYYVLSSLGYSVCNCFLVYIDSNYVRKGDLELDKLFHIEDVTKLVLQKQEEVRKNIQDINQYMEQKTEPICDIGNHCVKPYECPFFAYCTRNLPKNNVFDIRRMSHKKKFELYHSGNYTYEDLLKLDIDAKAKQQIEFELYDKKDYIDKNKIRDFMQTLRYPLYFLDFETYQQSIPKYDYVKPYMQIPFQYSLHYIESENGTLCHKEFLAESDIDPRRALAEQLVQDIPLDVCTVAYNMMFEKMVIKNLAFLYPDLRSHLMNIYDNMKDLMIPFKDRYYYTKDMHGSYSIKYVLPALFPDNPKLNYHNLDMVHNGSEAMNSYATLGILSKEKQEKLRYNLLRYCELDTYAMVMIWECLKNI